MNAHSFRFLVVHSGMHAVVKQALNHVRTVFKSASLCMICLSFWASGPVDSRDAESPW
jgi:hypothetical protein